ncbi:hypothetical protein H074_00272 [Amycolatopsis decaplanina DSM 44594]|uniref:Uncharacterized protein n=1 Tax=Amycolatopsis decaplanina DSM 44594 TaxID=1284240 RepID=M2ZZE8_9PSEU|nr:hypothetical protein H074_00272 [Amycolatopsis decaplanina DSM 44594]
MVEWGGRLLGYVELVFRGEAVDQVDDAFADDRFEHGDAPGRERPDVVRAHPACVVSASSASGWAGVCVIEPERVSSSVKIRLTSSCLVAGHMSSRRS